MNPVLQVRRFALSPKVFEDVGLCDGEINTACAQACPARALVFGDLNDPESEVSRLSRSSRGSKLLEDVGTKPKVTYLSRGN